MQQPIVLVLVGIQQLRVGHRDIGGDGMGMGIDEAAGRPPAGSRARAHWRSRRLAAGRARLRRTWCKRPRRRRGAILSESSSQPHFCCRCGRPERLSGLWRGPSIGPELSGFAPSAIVGQRIGASAVADNLFTRFVAAVPDPAKAASHSPWRCGHQLWRGLRAGSAVRPCAGAARP